MIVPDYERKILIAMLRPPYTEDAYPDNVPFSFDFSLNYSVPVFTPYLYVAPENGWIQAIDCYTELDYEILINPDESTLIPDTYSGTYWGYHKCGGSLSSDGMVPVRKGDRIWIVSLYIEKNLFASHHSHSSRIWFVPAKTVLN